MFIFFKIRKTKALWACVCNKQRFYFWYF